MDTWAGAQRSGRSASSSGEMVRARASAARTLLSSRMSRRLRSISSLWKARSVVLPWGSSPAYAAPWERKAAIRFSRAASGSFQSGSTVMGGPVGKSHGDIHVFGVVSRIVDCADGVAVRHLVLINQIASPNLHCVKPALMGRRFDQAFDSKYNLWSARGPISLSRGRV